MGYKKASATEMVEALCEQERHPDPRLIQALLERGHEIVPGLIELVGNNMSWSQIHAAPLLCELRAKVDVVIRTW